MKWVSLQLISLGLLLIFNDQTSFSAAQTKSSKCISGDELEDHSDRFLETYWQKHLKQQDKRTNRTRRGLNSRSLSPWKFRLDYDVNRIPHHIVFAKCLYQGCIINQRENLNYNSVPVFAQKMVMKKTKCKRLPNTYKVKERYIKVPVACVCVVPKSAK
ncbi:interleukin-17C-like [Seriola dumerili]|uniref:Interleukin-17C-like n=1 Tax=Seriola dumerili TaxID=41447 RepID=A0A3B4VA11_SERDU|nr:interleukin-17C-like [Seriola dumerili]